MRTLSLVMMLAASAPAADPVWAYFGGPTSAKNGGKGIVVSRFDAGKLGEPALAYEVGSPGFFCLSPDEKTLYTQGSAKGRPDSLTALRVDKATGKLLLLNSLPIGGAGPCFVGVDAAGEFCAVANYGDGSVALFRLGESGRIVARTALVTHAGTGPNKERQERSHAHCCRFDATGQFLLVCDLGTDEVRVYRLNRAAGTLTAAAPIKMPPGSGPRHMDFTEDGKTLFVNGELDSTVNVVSLDLPGGQSKVVQSLSTLPVPTPGNTTAECRVHPSGKTVYVSNRGHDSIAALKYDAGKLSTIGYAKDGIKVPRNFNFDPSGKYLIVANQNGNDVVVFAIGDDGLPVATGVKMATPSPICVKFVGR